MVGKRHTHTELGLQESTLEGLAVGRSQVRAREWPRAALTGKQMIVER